MKSKSHVAVKEQKKHESKQKIMARVLCLILAVLMVGGSAYYLFYMIMWNVSAADYVPATSDYRLRVGLYYDDDVPETFSTTSSKGYTLGVQPLEDGKYIFRSFMTADATALTVTLDENLKKDGNGYAVAGSFDTVDIGHYHIELATDCEATQSGLFVVQQILASVQPVLAGYGLYGFPVYTNGVLRIRIGSFVSAESAYGIYTLIASTFSGYACSLAMPNENTVSVLNTKTGKILLEYDCSDGTSLGMLSTDENDCIRTAKGNPYEGVFAYNVYGDYKGISVTNVVPLEQYVASVVANEISGNWDEEALKAFTVCARSYAVYMSGHSNHAKLKLDLCSTNHCQLYKGTKNITESIRKAVADTAGIVIAYNGEVCYTPYSSSTGGCTVDIGQVWGYDTAPYLKAVSTPWERYANYSYATWKSEFTPAELCNRLQDNGYTELSGTVTKVEVLEYARNSSYVYKIRFTASNGASVTLTNTDKIRTVLGLNSANFVVGKGSVQYTTDRVSKVEENSAGTNSIFTETEGQPTGVSLTAISKAARYLKLKRNSNKNTSTTPTVPASTTPTQTTETTETAGTTITENTQTQTPVITPETTEKYTVTTESNVATASNANNWIFVGKGWGHGAGISQYGIKDLANFGYSYQYIIHAYFTGVEIVALRSMEKYR